ncbi:hypothetical protein JTE90_001936 [Oedothorax gibbosus]|uniref:SEC7 domain-containing protein n=1 Tax=Oedothorax gibbosus TaxID=931172 RepID=A0AAV6VU59_9ARAC|nr:hypothetical protein JTE90_001936 [Oedothorax gibbosus]
MEDVLAKIMKDASSTKHAHIKQSCLQSQELLANQHELMRSPPYEIRFKVLETLRLALESKQSKLVSDALNGFQRMIWDKSFQSVFESEKEENWIPMQIMTAMESINVQSDDIQVEILKILLNMTSTHGQSLTSRSIIMLTCLCLEAFSNNAFGVRTAAQATINQTLTSFCAMLQETDVEEAEDQTDDSDDENAFNLVESVVEELNPVLHFMCEKLKDINCNRIKYGSPLLLQCILSILRNMKIDIFESSEFINFLWQELCPLLVALLGSPKTDKNIISSQKGCETNEIGRGSGCLAAAPSIQHIDAKTVYSIAIELVRLTGSVGSLRPVLESLFHRMLLYPPVQHRLDALKAVKELFSKPDLLLQLAAPPLHATSDKDWISLDLDLIKIAIDSLGECCHSNNNDVCYASVTCILELLKSLEDISCGNKIKDDIVKCINSQFRTLESSDYKGAKSERWLKTKLRSLSIEKEMRDRLRTKPRETFDMNETIEENTEDSPVKSINKESLISDEEDKKDIDAQDIKQPEIDAIDVQENISENFSQEEHSYEGNLEESVAVKENSTSAQNKSQDTQNSTIKTVSTDYVYEETATVVNNIGALIKETNESTSNENLNKNESIHNEESDVENIENNISSKNEDNEINLSLNIAIDFSSGIQDITSPVTESAEDALNYVSSSTEGASTELEEDFENPEDLPNDEDRLKKIPRTLLGNEDAGKEERERIEKLCLARLEFAQQERQNARRFVKVFQSFLPELLAIRSSIEADQALQEFASKYCESLWKSQQSIKENAEKEDITSHITILNADGIYLALYSALLLNLKLIRCSYYKDLAVDIPLTEQQFIEEVHGSGVLVYLSATWLAELYQQVLATNFLEEAGYQPVSLENSALVNLLSDVDGLGNSLPGTQQLADYRRLEKAVINSHSSPKIEAGRKFSRRILTCCWETVLEVLSVLLNGTNSCGISSIVGFLLGTEGAKEEHRKTKDAIAESLDGLQRAAKLCNDLGLQSCCSAVFSQLAIASCPLSEATIFPQISFKFENRHFKKSLLPGRSKALRLHASQLLSMDVILSKGLELGSHSPDCWKHVFQCCLFVLQLENTYFSGHGNSSIVSKPLLQTSNQTNSSQTEVFNCDYNIGSMPGRTDPRKLDITEIIKENCSFSNTSDVIKDQQLSEAIEALSQQVDKLFEDAASRLNLHALITFLVELCAASQTQLFTHSYTRFSTSSSHGSNLLLYHLGDVMLRCARGGRPLIHVMKAWSVVAPHFVEASCHKDSLISKKGVSTIHDIVSALLSSNSELPHFHFNEALFKPFENLLCLELCDIDIQEQIVSSICEFVEGCTTEIRSGWRPLFGALRTVQLPSGNSTFAEFNFEKERIHHLRVVLDVFEAFLATDNIFVFAYAAVDCLLCLLKHVKGPAELQDVSPPVPHDSNDDPSVPLDMCLAALKYLEKCSDILSSMYKIPTCPVFNSANRIQIYCEPVLVDPVISEMQVIYFEDPESVSYDSEKGFTSLQSEDIEEIKDINNVPEIKDISPSLQSLEKHTGIIHVWFLLLEGLAGTLSTCPKQYQSATMETLFRMLTNIKETPGPEFGIYCVNHLLLPMLQNWLRRTTKIYKAWENFATNFKQCCGLATDLIVDYIQYISDLSSTQLDKEYGVNLMLQQLFLVLTECVAQPTEIISRLGCACIRHAVMSAGEFFTEEMWDIVCRSLRRCCRVSLHSVKQLMVSFHTDSDNFYGDIGEVKVAARRDSSVQDSERLRQLSHQVFLLDCQQEGSRILKSTCVEDDERSFTFLLFPPDHNPNDPDATVIRVPFCSLVVGLLSHQILLQTVGSILLQGTQYMPLSNTLCVRYCYLSISLTSKAQDICETYTEITIVKEGLPTISDRMSDQPIFFLAVPCDEIGDNLFPSKQQDSNMKEPPPEPCYDSSDSEDLASVKGEETKDKIYTLASEHTINSLINQYKKRKSRHSMPSKLHERASRKSSSNSSKRRSSDDLLPEEIANQRRNSILKDGEAQLQVFKQLIQAFLELHQSLSDDHFKAYLPIFFPGVQFLVSYSTDAELKLAISEWLQRIAVCFDFSVHSRTVKQMQDN